MELSCTRTPHSRFGDTRSRDRPIKSQKGRQTINALINDSIGADRSIQRSVHEAGHKGVGPKPLHSLPGFDKHEVSVTRRRSVSLN